MRLLLLFFGTFFTAFSSAFYAHGQEYDSLGYPIPPPQKLFFHVSLSNLTGFGGGLEYQIMKNLMVGGILGARSIDWMRPVYRGNQINVRFYGGYQIAKTSLLVGGYGGTFDFAQNVEAATLYSLSLSVRTVVDRNSVWFVELGTTPMIPAEINRSGIQIKAHNPPPFIFLSIIKRFKDKLPEPDPLDNPYAYPPVMY
jgi:hypothetical protein